MQTASLEFMDEIEVPEYFICPISLQIMKDPVTAITGITYDRDSIEHWQFTNKSTTCPVTKQNLPIDSDLTPNHTLFRLIKDWCNCNDFHWIPTPKPPLNKLQVLKLLKELKDPQLQLKKLTELLLLATENERNKRYLLEAGVPKAMIMFILTCFRKGQIAIDNGLEEALSLLQLVNVPQDEIKLLLTENVHQIMDSITWILGCELENSVAIKSNAVLLLKTIIQNAGSSVLKRLKPELFRNVVKILRCGISQQEILNAVLNVLLGACPWGTNRIMMVQAGVVFELIEIELGTPHEKKTTELIVEILFHLCCCADGRAEFLSHKGGITMLTERILKVSPAVDDKAMLVLSLISEFCGTRVVLQEMLEFGTVSKLCMLLHADCASYLRDKAFEILQSHADVWKDSPCVPDRNFFTRLQSSH